MNLSLTLASSCSLLATLLVVAPALADDAPAPAAPPPAYALPPAQGPGTYGAPVYGAPVQQPLILEEHRASPGLIVGGSLLTFAGLGAAVAGAFSYVIQTGVVCDGGIDGSGSCGGSGASGIALIVGGTLAAAGGVTMIVFGARKVSTPRTEATLQLRPTGADLRLTF